jgi:TrmH family RNA methyltransferase
LLEEAVRSECAIPAVICTETTIGQVEARLKRRGGNRGQTRIVCVPPELLHEIAGTDTPQGVITLVKAPQWREEQLAEGNALVAVLDGIQDPGNAGTILRSAEAFGASGVIFAKGCVSPFNGKALRASAGSVFRLPILTAVEPPEVQRIAAKQAWTVYAAMPGSGIGLPEARLSQPCAVILGSEGHGVSPVFASMANHLRIPTQEVESLNAAIAASVILYEAARQRLGQPETGKKARP